MAPEFSQSQNHVYKSQPDNKVQLFNPGWNCLNFDL